MNPVLGCLDASMSLMSVCLSDASMSLMSVCLAEPASAWSVTHVCLSDGTGQCLDASVSLMSVCLMEPASAWMLA